MGTPIILVLMKLQDRYDILIIGAGPAGLIAALECYHPERSILILERMHMPALKLRISGKGRCNITNAAPMRAFLSHFGRQGRFLRHAFAQFFNSHLLHYFESLGVQFKLERGGRYFPQQDKATEVVKALLDAIRALHIPIATHTEVTGITVAPGEDFRLTVKTRTPGTSTPGVPAGNFQRGRQGHDMTLRAGQVLLATGGKSYPNTGSNGTGFTLAARLGHTITPLLPVLVPLVTKGATAKQLQGLSLRNVSVSAWCQGKKIAEQLGEMLFTEVGVSGPCILSLSRMVVPRLVADQPVCLSIDLKPALDYNTVDQRLMREIRDHGKQGVQTLLKSLLPRKMIAVFLEQLHLPAAKQLNQLRGEERKHLRNLLKDFQLDVTGAGSFDEAIVTSGGVSVQEINPRTLESRRVPGLYFAGEIIDIDADTGGFNLQAAFSTGWLAGRSLARSYN